MLRRMVTLMHGGYRVSRDRPLNTAEVIGYCTDVSRMVQLALCNMEKQILGMNRPMKARASSKSRCLKGGSGWSKRRSTNPSTGAKERSFSVASRRGSRNECLLGTAPTKAYPHLARIDEVERLIHAIRTLVLHFRRGDGRGVFLCRC